MKNKSTTITLVCLALTVGSVTSVMAKTEIGQSKYLGKKEASDADAEKPSFPKVNLLNEDLINKNPHFANKNFWDESDSSKVIKTEIANKELSDTLFDMMKVASSNPMGVDGMGGLEIPMEHYSGEDKVAEGKSFKPPKTALVGNDHHHNYSEIESGYSGSYNPYKFSDVISGEGVTYTIKNREWALDIDGKSLLLSELGIATKNGLSYFDHSNEVVADLADYFFESIAPITLNNLNIEMMNDNPDELVSGDLDFVLRDICVSNIITSEHMLVRFKVASVGYNIESADIFYGIKCGV
jgi:hypothetical protein